MNLTSKIRVWTASEKSLALIAKSKSAQISVTQAKGIIKQKEKKRKVKSGPWVRGSV